MTRQQAGVSAEAVGKLVAKWRSSEWAYAHLGPASDKPTEEICADELEALATAPPEQAAPVKSTLPVGVSVLVTNGELVLLGERINNTASGLLSTPGGRIEQNEDIFACAVRETQEETGLSLTRDLLKVIAWREHFRFGQHYFMFYVHAPQSFGTIVNKEPDKCKAWGWRTISHIKAEETTEPLDILALLATKSDPPQPASDGALNADWGEQEALDVIRSANAYGLPATKARWISCITTGLLRAFNRGQDALAAHDQKVRAEGGCAFCNAGDAPLGHLYHLMQEGRPNCGNCVCAGCASGAEEKK